MEYTIFYTTDPGKISDIYNDNIDVCVTDDRGNSYTFVVATPDNLKQMMSSTGARFLAPVFPFLVVDSISRENVEAVIQSVMDSPDEVIKIYGNEDI